MRLALGPWRYCLEMLSDLLEDPIWEDLEGGNCISRTLKVLAQLALRVHYRIELLLHRVLVFLNVRQHTVQRAVQGLLYPMYVCLEFSSELLDRRALGVDSDRYGCRFVLFWDTIRAIGSPDRPEVR